jgi:hypothetical protein
LVIWSEALDKPLKYLDNLDLESKKQFVAHPKQGKHVTVSFRP